MDGNLFRLIMEADGDLVEPFDAGAEAPANDATEVPVANDSPSAPDDMPPELPPDEGGDMSFDPAGDSNGEGQDQQNEEEGNGETGGDNTENTEDQKLSEKANNVLNQDLYRQFTKRNQEIEDIITNIQTITPVLSSEITDANDPSMARLKAALAKGQEYVLNTFVDSKYGENLLFFKKLDALYTALLNEINKNLKKVQL